ncbi:hypothetical protein Gogos_021960 [Gossypium gossypioides]|uniref:RNase H type-1 domain-containing protein n=1 Tax=Gossypium gossypioides TaxID=34282 RepID=A0A7J9D7N0_GOSGO|nr:hypothetical protein [Gossypium gossypioides]
MHAHISSIFATEVVACLQAIQQGLDLSLLVVEIEGDARSVIRKLVSQVKDRSEIEIYIKDSKQLCSDFDSCLFHFTHREANKVAHILTTKGIRRRENTYLMRGVALFTVEEIDKDQRGVESMS